MTVALVDEPDVVDVVYRDWLAARRLDNQTTSLRLHLLIKTHAVHISESDGLIETTKGLVRAASSLWQAACLSDRLGVYDDIEDDEFFLTDGIIAREFVADPAARAAPDWWFFSHMSNARDALLSIASGCESKIIVDAEITSWIGMSYKECWICHQSLLDRAVTEFETMLGDPPNLDAYQG